MAFFVLMSRVTLSPPSCDVNKTAGAFLKEGFVLDLADSVIKITNLTSHKVRGRVGVATTTSWLLHGGAPFKK